MSPGGHGPLTRNVRLRVAHVPGMPGTFSPPTRVSDPDMHHVVGIEEYSAPDSISNTESLPQADYYS